MTKNERKSFIYSNLAIFVIGFIYFIYKYFMVVESDYGPRPHELTATWLHLHIITAPIVILTVGYLLPIHILPKVKKGSSPRKRSGIFMVVSFAVMVISGYLLQMGFSANFDKATGLVHSIISGIWGVLLLWHSRSTS